MTQGNSAPKYMIVSPVKDEQKYLEATIQSVLSQSIRPAQWIIVDDGSQDGTSSILNEYCGKHDWIKVIRLNRGVHRQPGSAVIGAFNKGFELIKDDDFEFIVKLDCDLRFGPDYFEKLLRKFENDSNLGIASGIYLEDFGEGFMPVEMPEYHAAGASKVLRYQCFKEIGGFMSARGWDTIDEIRAQCCGWKTSHFREAEFYHLKKEGAGIGNILTNTMHGEIYYLTGGSKFFFLFKLAHRLIFGTPFVLGGLMMFVGYLKPLLNGKALLVSDKEAQFYKKMLNKRIIGKFKMP